MEYKDPGRYIAIIYLLYSWGSRFGVPSRVPLNSKPFYLLPLARIEQALDPVFGDKNPRA